MNPQQTWPILLSTGLCGLVAYASVAVVVEFGPAKVLEVVRAQIRSPAE